MLDKIEGRIYVLGDDINTDDIVPSHTLTMRDPTEMAKYTLEFVDPEFAAQAKNINIIFGGEDFGTGSSREEAVNVFKILGIKAIVAKSFARIYFRNLINNGIPAITLDWGINDFKKGDEVLISLKTGVIINKSSNKEFSFSKLPAFLTDILEEGGVLNKLKKRFNS
ncbi:MAG: 3-isopropylmalate dehydratase [Candidatus Lokiarchaeota archaeon]|nr:3-isopropylmalate dehydratase [Candidatus Lokiarchaeota archaeon]